MNTGQAQRMSPNMTRLMVHKLSRDAVPAGGGFADAVAFLSVPERVKAAAKAAGQWARAAVQAVRDARDPNPFKDASDEEIAGEILRQVESKYAKP